MKRLLISVPSAPNGFMSIELAWWITSLQIQSVLQDFGECMADLNPDEAQRDMIRGLAKKFGVGWNLEQCTLQWQDVKKCRDIGKPLVPDGWSIAMAPVFGSPIAAVRNEQVRRFLFNLNHETNKLEPTDFDAVLFIDTDNVPGRHDLHVLCEDIERDDVHVVGGVYCMEAPEGPQPLIYKLEPGGKGFQYDTETVVKPLGLHKLDKGGLPGGTLMVKKGVFEQIWEARRTWFKDRLHDCSFEYHEIHQLVMDFKDDKAGLYDKLKEMANERGTDWTLSSVGSWHIGEDIWFCRMCHELDIPIHIDTRVFSKHIKKADNKQTFLRQQAIGKRWFGMGVEAERGEKVDDKEAASIYRDYAVNSVKRKNAELAKSNGGVG